MAENLEIETEKKTKLNLENIILLFSLMSFLALFGYAYFTKDNIIKKIYSSISGSKGGLGDINYIVDCSSKDNKNTPYCQEKRARVEEDWRSLTITGTSGSKFKLGGKK